MVATPECQCLLSTVWYSSEPVPRGVRLRLVDLEPDSVRNVDLDRGCHESHPRELMVAEYVHDSHPRSESQWWPRMHAIKKVILKANVISHHDVHIQGARARSCVGIKQSVESSSGAA